MPDEINTTEQPSPEALRDMLAEEGIFDGAQGGEVTPPSEQQIIENINRAYRIKSLQLKLQNVNTAWAQSRVEELKALTQIVQITQGSKRLTEEESLSPQRDDEEDEALEGEEPHKLTEEDIARFPILRDMKPGQYVYLSQVLREQEKLNEHLKNLDQQQHEEQERAKNPVLERQDSTAEDTEEKKTEAPKKTAPAKRTLKKS